VSPSIVIASLPKRRMSFELVEFKKDYEVCLLADHQALENTMSPLHYFPFLCNKQKPFVNILEDIENAHEISKSYNFMPDWESLNNKLHLLVKLS